MARKGVRRRARTYFFGAAQSLCSQRLVSTASLVLRGAPLHCLLGLVDDA